MAKHEYENKGPVYLTYAKYEEYRVAGTLEVGREYRIINSEELFDCTYDTTTYAEITEAITNLRLPVCTYGGRKYYYVSESNNTYEFSCCAGSKMYQITVTSGNVWSNAEASSGNITSRDATEGESIPLLELGTKVIANPEIPSGTEATQLNALKVGNGYYSAGGGGGVELYQHEIKITSTSYINNGLIFTANLEAYIRFNSHKQAISQEDFFDMFFDFNENFVSCSGLIMNTYSICGFRIEDMKAGITFRTTHYYQNSYGNRAYVGLSGYNFTFLDSVMKLSTSEKVTE